MQGRSGRLGVTATSITDDGLAVGEPQANLEVVLIHQPVRQRSPSRGRVPRQWKAFVHAWDARPDEAGHGDLESLAVGQQAGDRHRGPPRGVTILAGFFALTVGAIALQGLTALAGNPRIQASNDIRDAAAETVALTLGLIAEAVPAAAIAGYRRRARSARPADGSGLA